MTLPVARAGLGYRTSAHHRNRVNDNRIDARVQSDDGRAWLAVLWSSGNPTPTLVDVQVYERPQPFRGHGPEW